MTEVSELRLDSDANLNGFSSHLVKGCLFIINTYWHSSQRWSSMDLQILKTKIFSIPILPRPQQPWLQSSKNDSKPMVLVFAPLEDMSHLSSQILLYSLELHGSLSSPPWPLQKKPSTYCCWCLWWRAVPGAPRAAALRGQSRWVFLENLVVQQLADFPSELWGSLCHGATWVTTGTVTRYS